MDYGRSWPGAGACGDRSDRAAGVDSACALAVALLGAECPAQGAEQELIWASGSSFLGLGFWGLGIEDLGCGESRVRCESGRSWSRVVLGETSA